MRERVRIGAVSYLNARPLVFGLEQGLLARRIEIASGVPSELADRLAAGDLDIALLPTIELARIPSLTVVPGLAITSHGAAASVVLVTKRPLAEIGSVALDPESRTSNALCRVLFAEVWRKAPEFRMGASGLEESLSDCDAAVRIGDKALFERDPGGTSRIDLGEAWTSSTGLPFVFAVWAASGDVLDRDLYEALHASLRQGRKFLDAIADDYTWKGRQHPEVSRSYLRENIRYRLGSEEMRSLRKFLAVAGSLGIVPEGATPSLAKFTLTSCDVAATRLATAEER